MKTSALLLALPLLALGCRDNHASVEIQAMCAMTDNCTFGDTCGAQYLGTPTVDATQTGHLTLVFQIENQLATNANSARGKLNTNDAHLDQAVLEFQGPALGKTVIELPNFYVAASANSTIALEVIPSVLNARTTLQAYAPGVTYRQMVANLRLRGYFDDGARFETGEFPIGINVCSGCVTATSGLCATAATCPPASNGQLPITCM